ncbi:hypothetical protein E3N88_29326 [Mikania micrantha]|uniref:Uncharacterized protein n=1 Tax=Mikania micrantha TaxID=192012 RepID=A0A5N6MIX5_9ASTR|nr:hypothetical protein E3N88_29326 [Mikania micrantha]
MFEPNHARRVSASKQISDFGSAKADFGTDLAISTRTELNSDPNQLDVTNKRRFQVSTRGIFSLPGRVKELTAVGNREGFRYEESCSPFVFVELEEWTVEDWEGKWAWATN